MTSIVHHKFSLIMPSSSCLLLRSRSTSQVGMSVVFNFSLYLNGRALFVLINVQLIQEFVFHQNSCIGTKVLQKKLSSLSAYRFGFIHAGNFSIYMLLSTIRDSKYLLDQNIILGPGTHLMSKDLDLSSLVQNSMSQLITSFISVESMMPLRPLLRCCSDYPQRTSVILAPCRLVLACAR